MKDRLFPVFSLVASLTLLLVVVPAAAGPDDARGPAPITIDAPGDLDPTFDGDGVVRTDFGGNDWAHAIVVDAAGRIVVAGDNDVIGDFVLARYLPDGRLDPSFGTGGKVTIDLGPDYGTPFGLALDAADRIVVTGECGWDLVVMRLLADGSLDPSFGSGGTVITDLGGYDRSHAVAIDDEGRIVVAGSTYIGGAGHDFLVARYLDDGTLDAGFGSGGSVIVNLGGYDHAYALALDTAGRIVTAGSTSDAYNSDFALVRFLPAGTLDASFGTGGVVTTDFLGQGDQVTAMVLDAVGRIVVAGEADLGAGGMAFALARYLADGSLDPSFGTGGKVTTDFGGYDTACFVAVDMVGHVVAGGHTSVGVADLALARYLADGTLDASFGTGGKVITDLGGEDRAYAGSIYGLDRIVAAGRTRWGASVNYDFVVARYVTGYAISGRVTLEGEGVPGVTLSAGAAGSAVTDENGDYALGYVDAGSYVLTPMLPGRTFDPPVRTVEVPPSATDQDFSLVPIRVYLPLLLRSG